MVEPGGLRERKKCETRHSISAAALELAVAHGPGAVTVEDIAAAANVSPRTVFNHFPTKEAAIIGFDPDRRAELLRRLRERPPGEPPLEAIRLASHDFFSPDAVTRWRMRATLAREHPPLHAAYVATFASLEGELTEVVAERTGLDAEADPYPRLVVAVAVAALRVALGTALDSRPRITIPDSIDAAFASLAAGLPAPTPSTRAGRARRTDR